MRLRRAECIKAIKVFEASEKKIRMDPDISKLVRRTEKESKYVLSCLYSMKSSAWNLQIRWEKKKRKEKLSSMSWLQSPNFLFKIQNNKTKKINLPLLNPLNLLNNPSNLLLSNQQSHQKIQILSRIYLLQIYRPKGQQEHQVKILQGKTLLLEIKWMTFQTFSVLPTSKNHQGRLQFQLQ